ncbi:unnamed protein product [Heterobilharzia americana]|nr:unnamed protein product [Heterobilharzia americana]
MDIGVGQESKAFISTSIQDGSSFSSQTGHSTNTLIDITTKSTFSPAPASENCLVLEKISDVLDSSEMKSFFTPGLISNYQDETLQRLEQEAQIESKILIDCKVFCMENFRISEAKLAIHKEKQTSLQELMDAIEVRKHLPNLSFVDDVL